MGCFLVLNSFAGHDQQAAAKKLALMFRMAPQQANAILEKVANGEGWRTPREVSDQQAAVAENYLTGIGFQVERSGQQAVVDQIAGAVAVEEAPVNEELGSGLSGGEDSVIGGSPGEPPRAGGEFRPPGNGGATHPGGSPPQDMPIGFHGTGGGLFKIMLINWILTFFTLGIYYFWGKTKIRNYLWEQSSFAGDRFHYHGTGGELFKGAVIFGVMLSLLNAGIFAIGSIWGRDAQIWAQMLMPYIIVFLLPVIMVGAFRYRLSRTAWRGIRFSFRGKRKRALWIYIKGYVLTIFTLGFYWPYFMVEAQKFWRGESYFGSQSFNYKGEGKDIMLAFLLMILSYVVVMTTPFSLPLLIPGLSDQHAAMAMILLWIPLIIGYMYYSAFLDRYHWSKTRFAGGTFNYDATGGEWFMINFTNFLLIFFTLGLALPLATVRSRRFLADHLAVAGNMQLSKVVQEAQKSSALGEGAADGFDMDIDIGI